MTAIEFKRVSANIWELPREGEMKVPGRVYANDALMKQLRSEVTREEWNPMRQLRNVCMLPGIQKYGLALPDVHAGYGSPIGGVGAFDLETGVLTFGMVGFDINCSVRTILTPLHVDDVRKRQEELGDALFERVPAGLGTGGKIRLSRDEVDALLEKGAEFSLGLGYGLKKDLETTEENGRIANADPSTVSDKAKERIRKQLGTVGSGNHYAEVEFVAESFDEAAAKAYGLEAEQVVVTLHCGSRGLGHQIGSDYLQLLDKATNKYKLPKPDRELVSAPIQSEEGQRYLKAINCGINTAFANHAVLMHLVRDSFNAVFGLSHEEMPLMYAVSHNTAKIERHEVDGAQKKLLVQRKGSTRGFGPGREEVPDKYRRTGQPVIIGGSMGVGSFVLKGMEGAMKETFGSTVHGAGRQLSRTAAKGKWRGEEVIKELQRQGILIKGHSRAGVAEEAPGAYKDLDEVVNTVHEAGISGKVARLKPLICVKG